ncbi:MAG: hypothetical protein ONB48_11015 [candidate division KSB1 bacterium]|nr:hypothetical protein [candidate division KSB1 bacterium]MDZ7275515.1 hypothetical protein [candidate division KSB1 bacterium]MDZ7286173.1 hypothetical protein [candidate division KSB1 bacterium]MDZ7296399.1 hypothetical protein [candidate division KSB1 bacterium]MDZ7306234.1 hypothetical protein [candidate division KSB1 bacterium]
MDDDCEFLAGQYSKTVVAAQVVFFQSGIAPVAARNFLQKTGKSAKMRRQSRQDLCLRGNAPPRLTKTGGALTAQAGSFMLTARI